MRQKIIVVLGQTATGKSDLAIRLAVKFGGEVISADSRQVYKGLNIGTGKITKKEMHGIPHHLLDVANPQKRFTVADYLPLARKAIADIHARGKLPIICGGTGFYIDTLLGTITLPHVSPDMKLRKKLEGKSAEKLFAMLKKLSPARAKKIDQYNPRRLIRAIEVAKGLTLKRSEATGKGRTLSLHSDILKIGLRVPDNELKKRISIRLFARLRQGFGGQARMRDGMVSEGKKLHAQGLSWKRMEELGLEYRYLSQFLQKKITKEEMLQKLNTEIWHYAKRQKTWFKRDKKIEWFSSNAQRVIISKVKNFLIN